MAMDFLSRSYKYKKRSHSLEWLLSMLALPIFPGRLQPSIVGRSELNFRVRDGNGWTLALISTNFYCNRFPCNKHMIHFLSIFPCSRPQSIVGASELNFCVRDGNRWTLVAINTNYFVSIYLEN